MKIVIAILLAAGIMSFAGFKVGEVLGANNQRTFYATWSHPYRMTVLQRGPVVRNDTANRRNVFATKFRRDSVQLVPIAGGQSRIERRTVAAYRKVGFVQTVHLNKHGGFIPTKVLESPDKPEVVGYILAGCFALIGGIVGGLFASEPRHQTRVRRHYA